MKATLIKVNGEQIEVTPANGTDFKCAELHKLLELPPGGLIEVVPLRVSGKILICDEEGMRNNAQPNAVATTVIALEGVITPPQGILGNVIICDNLMLQ